MRIGLKWRSGLTLALLVLAILLARGGRYWIVALAHRGAGRRHIGVERMGIVTKDPPAGGIFPQGGRRGFPAV